MKLASVCDWRIAILMKGDEFTVETNLFIYKNDILVLNPIKKANIK